MIESSIDRLIDQFIDRLIDSSIDRLIDGSMNSLIDVPWRQTCRVHRILCTGHMSCAPGWSNVLCTQDSVYTQRTLRPAVPCTLLCTQDSVYTQRSLRPAVPCTQDPVYRAHPAPGGAVYTGSCVQGTSRPPGAWPAVYIGFCVQGILCRYMSVYSHRILFTGAGASGRW